MMLQIRLLLVVIMLLHLRHIWKPRIDKFFSDADWPDNNVQIGWRNAGAWDGEFLHAPFLHLYMPTIAFSAIVYL